MIFYVFFYIFRKKEVDYAVDEWCCMNTWAFGDFEVGWRIEIQRLWNVHHLPDKHWTNWVYSHGYESSHDFSNKNYWICCRTLWVWWLQFMALKTRLQGLSAEDLISNAVRYHRNCYTQLTSKTLIDRAKARFEKGTSSGFVSDIRKKKRGRPSDTDSANVFSASKRCARDAPFDKEKCVICQDYARAELHKVSTKNMGLKMRNIGLKTSNDSLKVRQSSVTCSTDPLQAVADDMKYHLPCLIQA